MANNDRTARLTVTLNGEQPARTIDDLQKRATDLRTTYDSMLSGGNVQSKDAIAALAGIQKELKLVESQISRTVKANIDFEQTLADMSGKTAGQLNTLRSALNTSLKGMSENASKRKEYEGYLETINAQIFKLTKGYTQAAQASQNADELSMKAKRDVLTQLRAEQDLVKTNSSSWGNYEVMIRKVSASIDKVTQKQKESNVNSNNIAANPSGYTRTEAKGAVADLESQKAALRVGDISGWNDLQAKIDGINEALTITPTKIINVSDVLSRLDSASADDLRAALEKINAEFVKNQSTMNPQAAQTMKDNMDLLSIALAKAEGKYIDVADVIRNLDKASEQQISKAIKQLEEEKAVLDRTSPEYTKKVDQIKLLQDATRAVKQETVNWQDVLNNLDISNTTEINSAIQQMEKLKSAQVLGSQEWNDYGNNIQKAKDYLASFSQQAQKMDFPTAYRVDQDIKNYTRGEAQEAISVLQNSKSGLHVGDMDNLKIIEEKIKAINNALSVTEKQYARIGDILRNPANFSPDQIKAGIKQVEESLNKMTMGNANRSQREQQLENLKNLLKQVNNETVDVNKVLNNLKSSSLNDLKAAASQLEKEMADLSATSSDYIKKSAEYKQVKQRLDDLNGSWKNHDGAIKSVMNRLVAYIGIYGAFNMAQSKLQQMIQGNLELSDSMADIQKTTGLAAREVSELSKNIDSIDTRTSQEELHNLAFEAGKLGITGKENLMQFVEAGNQVLVALGEDLGGTDAIKNLMKINDVLGETKKLGIEKALLATGSAINEVGQSSTASEGYIADFAQRMAGVAAQSHLTMAELVALGGTTDALGQNVEVSATTLNKVFVTLQSKTEQVARAAGVSTKALKDLLDQGKTMEAFQMVLAGLGEKKGGLGALAPVFKDMGSDGARMIAVMSSMVSGSEILQQQLDTSNVAFEQATSLTKEYNVKNESANAILLRIGNSIKEYFVNSTFVDWIKAVLVNVSQIPGWIERNYTWVITIRSAIIGLTIALTANKVAWIATLNAMSFGDMGSKIKALFATAKIAIVSFFTSIYAATTSVVGFTAAWNSLKAAMAKNWFTILLVVLASVGTAIVSFATKVSAAAKAWGEYTSEVLKAQLELHGLRNAIDRANTGSAERGALIGKLNEKYGTYLNFMLTETNYAKNQAWAYELINNKLRETLALKMKEKLIDKTMDKYSGPLQEGTEDLYKAVSSRFGEERANAMMPKIATLVQNYIGKSTDEISKIVSDYLKREGMMAGSMFYPLKYIKAQKNMDKDIKQESVMQDAQVDSFGKNASALQLKKLNEMAPGLLSSKNIVDLKNYISLAQSYMATIDKTSNAYKKYETNIVSVQKRLEELGVKPPGFTGSEFTEKELKKMETAKQKAARLELEREKKLIDESKNIQDAALADKQAAIKHDQLKGLITDNEAQHESLMAEREHYAARAMVLQTFLDGTNTELKKHVITDEHLRSEIRKDISGSLDKEAELQVAHEKKIKEILAENNPVLKVRNDYESQLSELNLFNGKIERLDKDQSEKRMDALTSLSKDSYTLTVDSLKSRMMANTEFAELTMNMNDNDYTVLLSKLQTYLDDTVDAETKAQEKKFRLMNREWDQSSEAGSLDASWADNKAKQDSVDSYKKIGAIGETSAFNQDIALSQERISLIMQEMSLRKMSASEQIKLKEKLSEEEQNYTNLLMSQFTERANQLSQYTDILGNYAGKWAASQLKSDKERKKSSKEAMQSLIKDSLQLTIKLAADWARRAIIKSIFDKIQVTSTITANNVTDASNKATQAQGIGAELKSMIASLFLSGTKAQGKEIASKGWVGIATGAALFALVMGLSAAASSFVSNMFPDSSADAATASTPKIAAGMLTYADGRYPVLGSDGQIYNPKYQSQMKTGVYNETSMGIFSEKEPEMVISGPTTRKLMLDYPQIMSAIQLIDRGGRVKTYADGRMPSSSVSVASGMDVNALALAVASALKPSLDNVAAVNSALHTQLSNGIQANINKYGKNGLIEQVQDGLNFYKKNKING